MDINQAGALNIERFREIMKSLTESDDAAINDSNTSSNALYRSLTLSLDTAQLSTSPLRIGFPFKSFIVLDATDANVQVNIRVGTRDSVVETIPLRKGSELQLPFPVREAYLDWAAQTGKTLTLLFFVRGQFSTNILNLINSGGISITDGIAVAEQAVATVTTAAASLFAQDTTRIKMMIMNYGSTAIFLGGSSAVTDDSGAFPGIRVDPNGSYAWESTAACYAIGKSGSANNTKIGLVKFS